MTKVRAWIGVVVVAMVGAASGGTPAAASPPRPVTPGADYTVLFPQQWCGDYEFGTLTVSDRLEVADGDDAAAIGCDPSEAGRLTLRVRQLRVEFDGEIRAASGRVLVQAAERIDNVGAIRADGVFDGTYAGGGHVPATGNGGEGHGGEGGAGVREGGDLAPGGSAYGVPDGVLGADGVIATEPGSRGGHGWAGAPGGRGGGQIVLVAPDIHTSGDVSARGADGVVALPQDCAPATWRAGGGGGSGGSIALVAESIRLTGIPMSVSGGAGGFGTGGGGGGAGGRIELIAPLQTVTASPVLNGGVGGEGLCSDQVGVANSGLPGGPGQLFVDTRPVSRLSLTSDQPWYRGGVPLRLRAAAATEGFGIMVCEGDDTSVCNPVATFGYPGVSRVDETVTIDGLPSGVHGLWSFAGAPGIFCNIGGSCQTEGPPTTPDVTVAVDNDAPATPTVSAPSPTGSPSITLSVTGVQDAHSGVAAVECSNDGETWTVCGPPTNGPRPWTIGSNEGTHTVHVRVIDAVGNASTPGTTPVVLDSAAPSTTASVTPDAAPSGWYRTAPTVTLDATDSGGVASITYRVTGANATGPTTVSGDTASFSLPGDGVSTVTYFATDTAGHSEEPQTLVLRIDKTAPAAVTVAADRAPDHDGWYNHEFTAAWTGTDATSGVAGCTVTPYSGLDTSSGTLLGTCTDLAGNTSADVPFAFRYDATAPTDVTGTAARPPDSNGWYNRPVAITFGGNDPTSGIASCTSMTYSGPDTAGTTVPGTCTDRAGNTASGSFFLKYDGTGPTTRINGAAIRISVGGPTGMNGTVRDNVPTVARVVVTFAGLLGTVTRTATCTSGCGTTNASWHVPTTGLLGLYTVTAQSTDAAGNTGPPSNAVTLFVL